MSSASAGEDTDLYMKLHEAFASVFKHNIMYVRTYV